MRGGVVGGGWQLGCRQPECRPSVDDQLTPVNECGVKLFQRQHWILVDSCHRGISIIISPHICSHPYGLAGRLSAGFYGLEWRCGASQASEDAHYGHEPGCI